MTEPLPTKKQPTGLYLTPRDRQIFHTIWRYDGLLSASQIRALFFTSELRMRKRMRQLVRFNYVGQPGMKERMSMEEMIYWLKEQGAKIAAEVEGVAYEDFKWTKKPRTDRLPHHMALNTFRVKFELEIAHDPRLELLISQGQLLFAQHRDYVEFPDTNGKLKKRYIEPDAFMIIHNRHAGRDTRAFIELDRATKDGTDIANEKVLPLIQYLASDQYQIRTGYNTGRLLFIVKSGNALLRLRYLKRTVEVAAKQHANVFWFTTYEAAMTAQSIAFDPIWYQAEPLGEDRRAIKPTEETLKPMSLMRY